MPGGGSRTIETEQSTDAGFVEDPILRYRYRFSREGNVLRVEMLVDPGGGVTVEHFHPRIEERFEVLEGELTFKVEGDEQRAGPGDHVVAAPGVRHAFQNTGEGVARAVTEADPPGRLQEFLEEAAALGRDGTYTRRGFPTGPGALLRAVEFADRYRDTVVFTGGAFPPPAFQRFLLPPLARLGRRRKTRR